MTLRNIRMAFLIALLTASIFYVVSPIQNNVPSIPQAHAWYYYYYPYYYYYYYPYYYPYYYGYYYYYYPYYSYYPYYGYYGSSSYGQSSLGPSTIYVGGTGAQQSTGQQSSGQSAGYGDDYSNGYGYSSYYGGYTLQISTNLPEGAINGTGTFRYSPSSSVRLVASPTVEAGTGTRYIFDHWSGDYTGPQGSGSVTMDTNKKVVANYKTQYYVSLSSQPSGLVSIPGEGWYDAGTAVKMIEPQMIVSVDEGTRYVFTGWTVNSVNFPENEMTLTIDKPQSVAANYKTQYYLRVESAYGMPSGEGWYDAGSTAQISVENPVYSGFLIRQVFDHWNGASGAGASASVLMDSPKTVTAVWQTDFTQLLILFGAIVVGVVAVGYARSRQLAGKGGVTQLSLSMTCPICHQPVPSQAKFCPECGAKQQP